MYNDFDDYELAYMYHAVTYAIAYQERDIFVHYRKEIDCSREVIVMWLNDEEVCFILTMYSGRLS